MKAKREWCCEQLPAMLARFNWMMVDGEPDTLIMPNVQTAGGALKVNHCPSCGDGIVGIRISRDELNAAIEYDNSELVTVKGGA